MRCAICGIRIDSVDDAVEQGWTPNSTTAKPSTMWQVRLAPTLCSKRVKRAGWKSKRSEEGKVFREGPIRLA